VEEKRWQIEYIVVERSWRKRIASAHPLDITIP
jgi:hypothetical protein